MYELLFTDDAVEDLRCLRKFEQQLIVDEAQRHLMHDPLVVTRNRKPLRPNALSMWEVRTGSYRIFYDVDETASTVTVKAVGVKEGNRLIIRGKEYRL